ncbi:MAG TPA: hypothetical protein VFO87_03855 [Nitrospira sp.]|nr:hypothetical protein [Nitrospira sp.]
MSILSCGTRLINATLYALVGLSLMVTGCSSTSKIAHNAKGSVALEEIMDWSFEASHPAIIDQTTILKIVKGVYFAEDQNGSRMSAAGSKPMRVFSDEDAEFLAPLLAQGLSKAKPEQLVVFRVSSSAGSGSEPTAGSIYVQQSAIHFTISKGAGATTFVPESAARAEQAPPYAAGGRAGVIAQVIDYHALAQAPMPAALPVAKTGTPQATGSRMAVPAAMPTFEAAGPAELQVQLTRAKDMLSKKETEIKVLRKESDWMKRELRDRDEEIKALKATVKVPKKKKAEAYRTP